MPRPRLRRTAPDQCGSISGPRPPAVDTCRRSDEVLGMGEPRPPPVQRSLRHMRANGRRVRSLGCSGRMAFERGVKYAASHRASSACCRCCLEMPQHTRVHQVFHVSCLAHRPVLQVSVAWPARVACLIFDLVVGSLRMCYPLGVHWCGITPAASVRPCASHRQWKPSWPIMCGR